MDGYKAEVLTDILSGMRNNEFYLCRVKGDDTKAINLDEEAVQLLIKYYEGGK